MTPIACIPTNHRWELGSSQLPPSILPVERYVKRQCIDLLVVSLSPRVRLVGELRDGSERTELDRVGLIEVVGRSSLHRLLAYNHTGSRNRKPNGEE